MRTRNAVRWYAAHAGGRMAQGGGEARPQRGGREACPRPRQSRGCTIQNTAQTPRHETCRSTEHLAQPPNNRCLPVTARAAARARCCLGSRVSGETKPSTAVARCGAVRGRRARNPASDVNARRSVCPADRLGDVEVRLGVADEVVRATRELELISVHKALCTHHHHHRRRRRRRRETGRHYSCVCHHRAKIAITTPLLSDDRSHRPFVSPRCSARPLSARLRSTATTPPHRRDRLIVAQPSSPSAPTCRSPASAVTRSVRASSWSFRCVAIRIEKKGRGRNKNRGA